MDSEQKYKEALERAKTYYSTTDSVADTELLELIFPELKESEDKKMRKWLIDYLDNRVLNSPSGAEKEAVSKSIAWLEKQRNKDEEILVLKDQIESLHAAIKATKNIHKIELEKLGFTTDKVEPKYNVGDWLVHNERKHIVKIVNRTPLVYEVVNMLGYHHTIINDAIENNYHLWTIKDAKDGDILSDRYSIVIFRGIGNEKWNDVIDYHIGLYANSQHLVAQKSLSHWGSINEVTLHPATKEQSEQLEKAMAEEGYTFDFEKKELKKIEQKSTDKVEPKYNVGDWLVHNERKHIVKIVNHTPFAYKVVNMLGYHHTIISDTIENNYHLWTIQDAKDGDVLAAEPIEGYSSSFVAIYKERGLDFFNSYCFIGFDGYFYENEDGHSTENIHPATKEQRDTLMKAMADEGYTFDFEKKELKRLKKY